MKLYLVRHLPVAKAHAGLCYGASDLASEADEPAENELVAQLRSLSIDTVVTSGLQRCLGLARRVVQGRVAPIIDDRWRERNFGAWEMQRWDDIHAADAAAIDRLMHPDFAPPNGESLNTVVHRVSSALNALPDHEALVVSHGGPIAIARALSNNTSLNELAALIPRPGEIIELELPRS